MARGVHLFQYSPPLLGYPSLVPEYFHVYTRSKTLHRARHFAHQLHDVALRGNGPAGPGERPPIANLGMAEPAAEIFSAASGWGFFLPASPVLHPKLQGSCGLRYPLLTMHDLNYFRDHLDVFAEMAKKRGTVLDLDRF